MDSRLRCHGVVALASAFLDVELSGETQDAVEWHLFECLDCAHYVGQLRQTVRLARELRFDAGGLREGVVEDLVRAFVRAVP